MVGPSAIGSVKGTPSSIISKDEVDATNVRLQWDTQHGAGLVGERTGAAFLHGQQNVRGVLRLGKACCDICHKCSLLYEHRVSNRYAANVMPRDEASLGEGWERTELTLFCALQRWKVCLIASMTDPNIQSRRYNKFFENKGLTVPRLKDRIFESWWAFASFMFKWGGKNDESGLYVLDSSCQRNGAHAGTQPRGITACPPQYGVVD